MSVVDRVQADAVASPHGQRLRVDLDRAKAFFAAAPELPTSGFVLPQEGSDTHRVMRALLARRTLRRLLAAIARRHAAAGDERDRVLYQACATALLWPGDAALERLCTEPELVSLATVAADQGAPDGWGQELARALLPEIEAANAADGLAIPLLPDLDGGCTLRRAGWRLGPVPALPAPALHRRDGGWQLAVEGRSRPLWDADGWCIDTLPRLQAGNIAGPLLSPAPTRWMLTHVRGQELTSAGDAAFHVFCAAMRSGAQTLASAWPAAWQEVCDGIRWLLPLSDRGNVPNNYSVHAFRGLVASSPRQGHRCAQTLVHEAGHNRLSTMLDLVPVCSDPGRTVVSPVVNAVRPLSFVFHGCYAFAQDVALTERLLASAAASDRASMQRYLDEARGKARAALALLRREAGLTVIGSTLLEEIAAVVE